VLIQQLQKPIRVNTNKQKKYYTHMQDATIHTNKIFQYIVDAVQVLLQYHNSIAVSNVTKCNYRLTDLIKRLVL
jgi:hypothetical protein